MKDEIKEILDYLKIENGTIGSELSYEETHLLLDYITNLQTIEQQYSALLSENAELENRTKELEQINEEHRELNGNLRTANNTLCEVEEFMYNQAEDYKTRNEKAINCINHYATENDDYSKLYSTEEEELLEILQGSDE